MLTIPLALMALQFGACFVSRQAAKRLNRDDAMECLERHFVGDYGDITDYDWKANELACQYGFPVVSSYVDRKKNRFLIVTDADRSATTILLPEEY